MWAFTWGLGVRKMGSLQYSVATRWYKKKFSNVIFSATATDIAAVLSRLHAPLGSPSSAPVCEPHFGVRPPTQNLSGDPEIFFRVLEVI